MPSAGNPQGVVVKKLGFFETIHNLIDKDGVGALWRGIGPALVLVINPILQVRVYLVFIPTSVRADGNDIIAVHRL
jgi:hypothetical protein